MLPEDVLSFTQLWRQTALPAICRLELCRANPIEARPAHPLARPSMDKDNNQCGPMWIRKFGRWPLACFWNAEIISRSS